MTNTIKACVVSEIDTVLGRKLIIPTDTATIVPFDDELEAHYFCALANSEPFGKYVKSFSSAGRGFGSAAILKRVAITKFKKSNSLHRRLAILSKTCHEGVACADDKALAKHEAEIDEAVHEYWALKRKSARR